MNRAEQRKNEAVTMSKDPRTPELITMDAPSDYTPNPAPHDASSIESTGFTAGNLVRALNAPAAEIEAFAAVRAPVGVAEYRIGVLSADLERHLLSLQQDIRIRTAEVQAELALSDLKQVIDELVAAQDALLVILGRSDTETQPEAD